jgi:hypothetical protein
VGAGRPRGVGAGGRGRLTGSSRRGTASGLAVRRPLRRRGPDARGPAPTSAPRAGRSRSAPVSVPRVAAGRARGPCSRAVLVVRRLYRRRGASVAARSSRWAAGYRVHSCCERKTVDNERAGPRYRTGHRVHAYQGHARPIRCRPALLPARLVRAAIIGTIRSATARAARADDGRRRPTWTRGGREHGRRRRWPGDDPALHPRSRTTSRRPALTRSACAPCACWGLPRDNPRFRAGRRLLEALDDHLAHTRTDYVAQPVTDVPAFATVGDRMPRKCACLERHGRLARLGASPGRRREPDPRAAADRRRPRSRRRPPP